MTEVISYGAEGFSVSVNGRCIGGDYYKRPRYFVPNAPRPNGSPMPAPEYSPSKAAAMAKAMASIELLGRKS